jgi:hypothetical protein
VRIFFGLIFFSSGPVLGREGKNICLKKIDAVVDGGTPTTPDAHLVLSCLIAVSCEVFLPSSFFLSSTYPQ